MTDREMLELAAKAAGVGLISWTNMYDACDEIGGRFITQPRGEPWNPLEEDGDALLLAAKLKIDIEWQATNPFPEPRVEAYRRNDEGSYFCADEPEENYRRAIVRAAAEIGKAMP